MTEEELFLDIESGLRKIDLMKKYRIGRIKLDNYLAQYELEIIAPRITNYRKRTPAVIIASMWQYKAQGLDVSEIAEVEGVYPSTVRRWHIEHGLTPNPPKSKLGRPTKEDLHHLYHVLEWDMKRIAAHYGTNRDRVNGWIGHYGLRKYKQKQKDRTVRHLPTYVNEL